MYSGDLSPRDRAGPALAVVLVHLGLGAMLIGMSGKLAPAAVERTLKLFDVSEPVPPPPPPPPPAIEPKPAAARPKAAAPAARTAEASPIVTPKPRIVIPTPTPVIAAPLPAQGAAPNQGAADAGAGTGAGGAGSGTGGGGSGNGAGGDGGGGIGTHPRPLFRPLNARGFPRQLVAALPRGARVLIIFTVQLDGSISDCGVRQSSGRPELDALVCQVAQQRFRYDPARLGDGRPTVAKAAYMQVF